MNGKMQMINTNSANTPEKPAVITAMSDYFAADAKRIEHALKVVSYAESILAAEPEADRDLVIAAAALHDIGIKNAEAKHGSSSARYQEIEGPPVARAILQKLGYDEAFIDEVCDIVGHHHHPRSEETLHFRILYDADLLVNSEEARRKKGIGGQLERKPSVFLTKAGREIAKSDAQVPHGW